MLDTNGKEYCTGLAVGPNGNAYITGSTENALDGKTSAGGKDIIMLKVDPNGNLLDSYQWGSSENESCRSIIFDANGDAYLCGGTNGTLFGSMNIGSYDAYLLKLNMPSEPAPARSSVTTQEPTPLSTTNGTSPDNIVDG